MLVLLLLRAYPIRFGPYGAGLSHPASPSNELFLVLSECTVRSATVVRLKEDTQLYNLP